MKLTLIGEEISFHEMLQAYTAIKQQRPDQKPGTQIRARVGQKTFDVVHNSDQSFTVEEVNSASSDNQALQGNFS